MDYKFRNIGLIAKRNDPAVAVTLNHLTAHFRRRRLRVLVDEAAAASLRGDRGQSVLSREQLGSECDLVIVVGGDGTLLSAARDLADHGVALLGVNLGRLGFLADVSPADMVQRIEEIMAGRFREEHRSMVDTRITREDSVIGSACALNDVVLHKYEGVRIIEMQTYLDGQFINTYRADGLIVSTPTGSTAYNLSCGGPIVHPSLDVIVLLPICPHTLTNRPVVVDAGGVIEIMVTSWHPDSTKVICDGQEVLPMEVGDRLEIRRREKKLRLLHPVGHDYFEILRAKLGWGVHPK